MLKNSLSACISESLKQGEMVSILPDALLSHDRYEVLHRDETELWDYKRDLILDSPYSESQFAKDVLGFTNSKGGVIIVGVSDDFKVSGIPESHIIDTSRLLEKIKKYAGNNINIFQNSIHRGEDHWLWLIFIGKKKGVPIAVQANGPEGKDSKPVIRKGEYFLRIHDETKPCREAADFARLYTGYSQDSLYAYAYDIDEPYFRLLAPDCDRFVGRTKIVQDVHDALKLRHPIIALDGVGGVGKSAIAIEAIRQLYDKKEYLFIVSLSAKNKVWHQQVVTRQASFSGISELIQEIAKVLDIKSDKEVDEVKGEVISAMKDLKGLLLIDNIEEISDPAVMKFISEEIPDPVKVLVTSRIDKGLGAKTISVPEMTDEESRELLYYELRKVGFLTYMDEPEELNKILEITGRLPLGLRWAATLAANKKNLHDVYRQIRQTNTSKNEFLNFCFLTMYDSLPSLTRNIALLCPYLGEEWNPITLSIALDIPIKVINKSVEELKDRGILLASGPKNDGTVRLLPLTHDFFLGKWHENSKLQEIVAKNLSDALASDSQEGLLFNWPVEKRVQFLSDRIRILLEEKSYEKAEKLTDLAIKWSNDPEFLFQKGKIAYETKKINRGMELMGMSYDKAKGDLPIKDLLYFGKSLLDHGQAKKQIQGLIILQKLLPLIDFDQAFVKDYCQKALQLREFSFLRDSLDITKDHGKLFVIVQSIWTNLDTGMVVYQLGHPLEKALETLATAKDTYSIPRGELDKKHKEIQKLLQTISK